MKNCIFISTKKDLISIKIDEYSEQNEIVACLKKKLIELKKLYKNDNTPINVTGKVLKNSEIEEISNIIKSNIAVKVTFDSPTSLGLHGIKKTFNRSLLTSETKYFKGAVRSGQRLEYEGSIVIIGDVNDGSEVIASDNIVVLGALRGLAHAGAKGNKEAFIAASSIDSLQIRIANVIKEQEREEVLINGGKKYAYINENDVIVLD